MRTKIGCLSHVWLMRRRDHGQHCGVELLDWAGGHALPHQHETRLQPPRLLRHCLKAALLTVAILKDSVKEVDGSCRCAMARAYQISHVLSSVSSSEARARFGQVGAVAAFRRRSSSVRSSSLPLLMPFCAGRALSAARAAVLVPASWSCSTSIEVTRKLAEGRPTSPMTHCPHSRDIMISKITDKPYKQ